MTVCVHGLTRFVLHAKLSLINKGYTMTKQLYTEAEAAEYIGFSFHTLKRSRLGRPMGGSEEPPKHIKIGSNVRYKKTDLDSWIDSFGE